MFDFRVEAKGLSMSIHTDMMGKNFEIRCNGFNQTKTKLEPYVSLGLSDWSFKSENGEVTKHDDVVIFMPPGRAVEIANMLLEAAKETTKYQK